MKKYSLYKWLRCVAMLSGISILAVMFACAKKYGPPDDMNWGQVLDKETQEMKNDAPGLP